MKLSLRQRALPSETAIHQTEFFCNDKKIPVSMSFGISGISDSAKKSTEQIKHDLLFTSLAALAQAKQEGKDKCVLKKIID